MKKTLTLAALATLTAVVFDASPVLGQRPLGPTRAPSPTVSPYLNLLRRGTLPAVNYYGLVRPEMEMRNNLQMLQRQVTANQTGLNEMMTGADFGLPFTGKSVSFMNTSGYFMTFSPAGGSAGFGSFGGSAVHGAGAGLGMGAAPRGSTAPTRPLPPRR